MNARDELALVLANAQRFRNGSSALPSASHVSRLALDDADAVLAAGYRKPRTITTVDELDDLPETSAVLDEAVEAAAWALDPQTMGSGGVMADKFREATRAEARKILEAAAPKLTEAAWEEGYGQGHKHGYSDCLKQNPPQEP